MMPAERTEQVVCPDHRAVPRGEDRSRRHVEDPHDEMIAYPHAEDEHSVPSCNGTQSLVDGASTGTGVSCRVVGVTAVISTMGLHMALLDDLEFSR